MRPRAHHLLVLVFVTGACDRVQADHGVAALRPAGAVDVAVSLDARVDGEQISVAPDLWIGISDRLTLGVTTSPMAHDQFGATRGLCAAGCQAADDRFRGLDVAARFPLVCGPSRLTGEVATDIAAWSPARAALRVGVLGERRGPVVYARLRGELAIGLLGRADGNRDQARMVFALGAPLAGPVGGELTVGAAGPASEDFFGELRAEAGVRATLRPGRAWSASLGLGTDDLCGPSRDVFATLSVEVRVAS